ncbi:MAG: trehalose-phosphatase [Pseudonocardiaceae bacterium]
MTVRELPHALRDGERFAAALAGRRLAVFLDYDGVLTPIVDRPQDAVMSESMREAVRALARRCPVCVVSGRDRAVVQRLMGVDDLVVAGSHGFDIWSPREGTLAHPAASGFDDLISEVTGRLRAVVDAIPGAVLEPKRASVAVHYRLADPERHAAVTALVNDLLAEYSGRLKVTPGKRVYELQPQIDWNKGKAVLYLLRMLDLDADDVAALYLGDDITDEDAFRALAGRGIGIIVGHPDDPEVANRATAADFALESPAQVERFLTTLARGHAQSFRK